MDEEDDAPLLLEPKQTIEIPPPEVDTGSSKGGCKTKRNLIAVEDAKECFDECIKFLGSGKLVVDRTEAYVKGLIMRLKVQPSWCEHLRENRQSHQTRNSPTTIRVDLCAVV